MRNLSSTGTGGFTARMLVWILPFLLLSMHLRAQEIPVEEGPVPAQPAFQPAISFGLNAGTHAIVGFDATIGVLEAVNFRLAYNRVRADLSDFSIDADNLGVSDQTLVVDADMNLSTFGVLIDFPFTANKKFRVMGGAMFELDNFITLNGQFQQSMFINDYELTPERLGMVKTTYRTQSSIYPYLGLGFGRSVSPNRLSFAFEAGVYLRGKPDMTVESTGVLADNASNGPILSDNLESLQWHPSVGLRLAYSIGFKKRTPDTTALAEPMLQPQKEPVTEPVTEEEPATASAPTEKPEQGADKNTQPEAEKPKKKKEEIATEAPEQKTPPQPAKPKTPFLKLKGQVLDAETGENLPYVVIDLYQVKPDGSKQKMLSQRYPGGTFSIDLQRGATYEVKLSSYQFAEKTTTITADNDPAKIEMMKSFTLNKQ